MGNKKFQNIIDNLRGKNTSPTSNSKVYGKFYYPFYNKNMPISDAEHNIYNEFGQKMHTFFLRDAIFSIGPSNPDFESKYFIWDRYNFALKTHFYTHKFMLETMGKPDKRYGILIESESITPDDYNIFKTHKGLNKDFDKIFTYSAKILDEIDNAEFVPFCASLFQGKMAPQNIYKEKNKDISIVSSKKLQCEMHKFRYDLAWQCKNEKLADTFGTFDDGGFINIDTTLKNYRYSICIENDIKPYFFTERIVCTLANQTIPIYMGATEIDKFFNPDGIIKIDKKSDIKKVLKMCTKEEYERRLPAVLDNYERVKRYLNPFDYMYENYFMQKEEK